MILRFKMGQGETYFPSNALNPLTSDIDYIALPNPLPNRIQKLMNNPVSQASTSTPS